MEGKTTCGSRKDREPRRSMHTELKTHWCKKNEKLMILYDTILKRKKEIHKRVLTLLRYIYVFVKSRGKKNHSRSLWERERRGGVSAGGHRGLYLECSNFFKRRTDPCMTCVIYHN